MNTTESSLAPSTVAMSCVSVLAVIGATDAAKLHGEIVARGQDVTLEQVQEALAMVNRAYGSGTTALLYSSDGGANWRYTASFGNTTGPLANNGRQMLHAGSAAQMFVSVATGY